MLDSEPEEGDAIVWNGERKFTIIKLVGVIDVLKSGVCAVEAEQLRTNDNLRNTVAQSADDILSVVSAFMA